MSSASRGIMILIVIVAVAAGYFLLSPRETSRHQTIVQEQQPPPVSSETAAPPLGESQPLTRHPIPESTTESSEPQQPLPSLADSDIAVQQALGRLADTTHLDQLLTFKNFINRAVVTIDNLPRGKLPVQHLPNKAPAGKFLVKKAADGSLVIDPANYRRYAPFVELFTALDSHAVAAFYFHFYPLFQEAYTNLGYNSAYFNDRVIEVIDDLLTTPQVTDPVKLIQPSVFYKYADPRLEGLSAGQRLMIRIGSDNAARVKAKLRELRTALTKGDMPK